MAKEQIKLTDSREHFKPFTYPWAYDLWLKHEQSHWLHTEVPMLEDCKDWKSKLTVEEKHFLTQILRFFTQGDIDVAGGYIKNYLPKFPCPEVRMLLMGIAAREALHIAAYSHLIETLGMPDSTYSEFNEYEAMQKKHDYFLKLDASREQLPVKIAAVTAFTEGVQLFSSFIMLLNFPRHGKMKGMGQIITWSIIDETMHVEALTRIFRTYIEENRELWNDDMKSQIYSVADKMVELEDKFIDLAFQMGPMENLTADEVKQYIRYIADRRLIALGMKGIFKVKRNPALWVEEMINAPVHTNFFENRSTDYAKGALSGSWEEVWAK